MPSSFDNMIYACIFMFTAGVSGRITDPPLNAVADVGGQAILNCTSDLTVQNWVFSKTREEVDGNMPTVQTIVAGCVVQPGFTTNYEVDRPGGSNNKCNLIVKATTMQQAGVYTCTDTIAGPSSILTVIDGDASITVDKQEETVEEDVVTMSYTVRYSTSTASPNTPTIQPVLSWKDPDGNNITSSNSNTSTSVSTNISIKAERQDIRPYTCNISFEIKWPSPPTGLPFANNTPSSLSNPPPTSTINVLYGPKIKSITSSVSATDNCVYKHENLTCAADANPPAQYKWEDLSNTTASSGSVKFITTGGQYKCIASNSIRNETHNDTRITTENTCYSVHNMTMTGPSCANGICSCNGSYAVVLMCWADGFPNPGYQWRSDVPGHENLGNATTYNATIDGNYTCTASNRYGNMTFDVTKSVNVTQCIPHPTPVTTTPPSTTKTAETTTASAVSSAKTTGQNPVPVADAPCGICTCRSKHPECICLIIFMILLGLNISATGLFLLYYNYNRPEDRIPEANGRSGNVNNSSNKLRLNRKFPWLMQMLPCFNDIKETVRHKCLWITSFILLGISTGIVTFPVLICLAEKSEKNNERLALNARGNGAESESPANWTQLCSPSYPRDPPVDYPTSPPNDLKKTGRLGGPSPSVSKENIDLDGSLRFRNPLTESPTSKTSGKPIPANKPINSHDRSKDYTPDNAILYSDLPYIQHKMNPAPTPVQFLDLAEDHYAVLRRV